MPDAATLDLDSIARAAGAIADSPPSPTLDLDAIARSAPADDILANELKKRGLRDEQNWAALAGDAAGYANRLNPANLFKVPDSEKTIEGGILPQTWLGIKSGFATVGQGANKLLELAARSGGINPIQSELLAPGSGRQTVEQFRGASEIAGQWAREAEQLGQITQGPDWVRTVAGGVVSMLPAAAAAPLGLPAAVVAVGLQSFGSTFSNAEESNIARGDSPTVARRKALWPALATGVGTALITRGFGATGIENWTKAISSGAFRETLKSVAKAAGLEGTEEFYDQVQQRLWAELSYQPSANFTQALERTLEEASLAGLSGGIAAGGLRAVTAGSGRREPAEPGAVPPSLPVAGSTPARRSAAAFATQQGIPVGAEPVKPIVPVPAATATEVRPTEQKAEVPSAVQIEIPAKIPVQPAAGGSPTVVKEIPKPEEPAGARPVVAPEVKAAAPEVVPPVTPVPENRYGVRPVWLKELEKPENADILVLWKRYQEGNTDAGWFFNQGGRDMLLRLEDVRELMRDYPSRLTKATAPEAKPADPAAEDAAIEKAKLVAAQSPDVFKAAHQESEPNSLAMEYQKAVNTAIAEKSPVYAPWADKLQVEGGALTLGGHLRSQGWIREGDLYVYRPAKPEASPGARITLANNKTIQLPEFTLEAIRRGSEQAHTGRTFPASVMFNPRDKEFLLIKGPAQRASYKIPLSEIPHDIIKGGISFDKQAVLDFLNDKARRQAAMAAMIEDRHVTHFAPEDIDLIQKPIGRPATGAGAPLGEVTMDTKKLEALAPAAPGRRPMDELTRKAFDKLLAKNPKVIDELIGRRPEELDEAFWNGIHAELAAMAEYKNVPGAPEALVADLKRLKDGGDLEWLAAIPKGWGGITGVPARAAQEAANLKEARRLVDDPNNGLSEEAKAVLRTILDSPVAAAMNGRQIRFRLVDALEPGVGGRYHPIQQLIELVRGTDPELGAHEFFHPLWEMIQDADRANVKTWRDSAIAYKIRTATGKALTDLQKLAEGDVNAKRFRDEGFTWKFYHLSSTEEFFAWMMTSRFMKDRIGIWGQAREIFASQDAFLSRVRQIIELIFDAIIQRLPGVGTPDVLERTILDGTYDFLPPSENIPGKKLVTKNAVITAPGVGPAAAITAYHGTPHQFERFKTERIGTGEGGVGAYGHGIYFAEHTEVAKSYANNLSVQLIDGKPFDASNPRHLAWRTLSNYRLDRTKAIKIAEETAMLPGQASRLEAWKEAAQLLRNHGEGIPTGRSENIYTVRLDVEPTDLLDWDKPLNQQSPKVQQALAKADLKRWLRVYGSDPATRRPVTGQMIYAALGRAEAYRREELMGKGDYSKTEEQLASEYLNSLGIPGIRYLDQGSRGRAPATPEIRMQSGKWLVEYADPNTGRHAERLFDERADADKFAVSEAVQGPPITSNFVIFDESKIHITHENGQEVPLPEAMGKERGVQAALESRKNVEKYVEPLEQMRSPEFYRGMASVINRGLVPDPRAERYFALPMQVALELRDVFPYRIETQRPTGPTLREVMADEARTPEERNEYARNALAEFILYKHNREEVKASQSKVNADLDEATVQAIRAIPPTNEANVEAVNRLGQIIDRIQNERVKTAEGAQVNAIIGEGIEHIDALNQLLRDAPAHSRALSGIARLVGRAALTAERPGENVLELISERSGHEGGVFATPREWISALATHLDQMRTPEDNRVINAGRDVIEGTLWGLRQLGDFKQHLLEVQMADDGTLRRFNADYLADLRSATPRGFNTILNKYAKVKVESDALNSAARRLNRKVDALTTRQENLRQAVEFLNEHDADPAFQDFGKAAAEFTGGTSAVEYTDLGPVRTYNDPMTGKQVKVEFTFDKGETLENLAKLKGLIESGLEYAAQPNADPTKAKFWIDWANDWEDYLMGINSDARLQDPHWIFNPMRVLTKSKIGLIVETTLSRLPGALAEQGSRAIEAFAGAKKAKDEWLKAQSDLLLGINLAARSKHPGMSLDRWQKEVASPIIDSRQHFGQEEYRTGQRIAGFGHLITPEDMKAVRSQYAYEQHFRKLHEKVKFPAITEAPVKIKEGNIQRFALSRGPGTVTHSIPKSTRYLPAQWAEALKVPPEQGGVDMFLSNKDNFIRIALKHVLEDDRDYILLGKGKFALDYRAMRAEKQSLQSSGQMPATLDGLSEWIARRHNESLARGEAPATPGEVRKTLVDEISSFMKEIEKNTAERQAAANAANMEIIVNENGFTQPRRGKIAPGTLYEYGLPDKGAMQTKGNEAIEFYAFRYRDAMQAIHDALLKDKEKLEKELGDIYGSTGIIAKHKLHRAIRAGNDPFLQKKQLTLEEVDRNLTRTGHFLNNINDIVKNRRGTYVDDVANHALNPWFGFAVGSALSRPLTWMRNMSSGPVLWGLKTAEIRRGGWMRMPDRVLAQHIGSFIQTMRLAMVPKTDLQRAIKQYRAGHPEEVRHTANFTVALLREAVDRQMMRDIGVLDSFSIRDNIGWDSERPLWQNIKIALDTMRNVSAHTESSDANSIFSTLGIIPRAGQLLTRKIGMRWADNWINSKGTQFTNGLANELRKRAIISFDGRLRSDPVFRELYEQYGDNYQRFSTALIGRVSGGEQGGLLTPAELTGKWGLGGMDKSAIQLRRTFRRNNDAVDLIMLKYWWNKRHANGDRNSPFFTDGERMALQFALAEDVNMGTMATRAQWWAGSKEKQWFGVLGQYWLWATDRMADMIAQPHGQKVQVIRYLPGVMAFLLASGIAAVVSTALGQKVNNALFNTVSQKPSFFDATDDKTRALAAISTAASLWGAFGSLVNLFNDMPGKLGYRNPFFFANMAMDIMGAGAKWYQSGDAAGPILDILARYQPAAQAIINRLPSREGLVEVRNAANAIRAATPGTLEAKRRQPSSGNDLRATPMTPLYNTILNAAATGDWATADEAWAKAVEQSRASGNPNPEAAILSAIRTRAPESAVFSRVLTDGERDMVYGRLTPEGRARVDRVNSAFDAIASRYGTGGAAARAFGGGSSFGALPRGSSGALADIGGFGGSRSRLSLGSPRGVRSGFRTRSLRRGLRTRRLRGLRRPRLRSRMRRLAV